MVKLSEFYVRGSDHVYSAQIMWVVRVICFFNMGLFGFVTLHVWNVAVWIRPGASVLGGSVGLYICGCIGQLASGCRNCCPGSLFQYNSAWETVCPSPYFTCRSCLSIAAVCLFVAVANVCHPPLVSVTWLQLFGCCGTVS